MSFLFGGGDATISQRRDPVKEMQSQLRASIRSITRDVNKAKDQEKILTKEIKYYAKTNKLPLCATKAKELVRLRNHQTRLQNSIGQMSDLTHSLSNVSNTQVIQECMNKTGVLLKDLNRKTDLSKIMKMMQEYQFHTEAFQYKQESIQETIDNVMQTDNEDEVTNNTVEDIYLELGLDAIALLNSSSSSVPLNTSNDLASQLSSLQTATKN